MVKNIVVCCDGTSNQPAHDMTNVVKLYFTLANDPVTQLTFYHPGLGTMEPSGALTPWEKSLTRTRGLAFGTGLPDDIRDAYVFIAQNFVPGDHLYLFGFSRGAYTARAVASLLHMYGLIEPNNAPLAPYAIRMMTAIAKADRRHDPNAKRQVFELADRFKQTFSRICQPWFVGVWDTVSSVGWFSYPAALPYTSDNPDIQIGRHAVAIDERRAFFRPNLWWPDPRSPVHGPKNIKQVWFPGSHSDVGGGYPNEESMQSQFALEWMIVEARAAGLLVEQPKVENILGYATGSSYVRPAVTQPVHESLTGGWWLAEFVLKPHYDRTKNQRTRRMNLGRRRTIRPDDLVHESAFLRGPQYMKRVPAGVTKERRVSASQPAHGAASTIPIQPTP
jgi:uncharacterized protein (DUF2235 family)